MDQPSILKRSFIPVWGVLSILGLPLCLVGQTNQPSLEKRAVVVATDDKKKEHPAPPRGPKAEPPASVKELVKEFKDARTAFLAQQELLKQQLRKASEEQREAIREKLRENLNNWLEVQRLRTEELREQARRIKEEVKDIDRVVDSAGEKGRGR